MHETWIIEQIKQLKNFGWAAFLIPILFPKIRKWIARCFKYIYKKLNELFCKLPFMTRLAMLEQNRINDVAMHQKWHDANTQMLQKISNDLLEIGRTTKKISFRQRNIENTLNIPKLEFDIEFNAIDCTNEFLKMVDKDKTDILGSGYINSIYYEDRKKMIEQLDEARKGKRENDFEIRLMFSDSSYFKVHCKIDPFLCIQKEIIGYNLTLNKI